MNRRGVLFGFAGLLGSRALFAQARPRRVGAVVAEESCDFIRNTIEPGLRKALAELGQPNVVFESHCFGSDFARGEQLAREMLPRGVDVIAVTGTPAARMVQRLTTVTPIMAILSDPVTAGFTRDLARPEGNMTGFTNSRPEQPAKTIELMRDIVSGLAGLVFVGDARYPEMQKLSAKYLDAAKVAGMPAELKLVEPAGIEPLLKAMRPRHAACFDFAGLDRARLAATALKLRVPTMLESRGYVEQGGLCSFSLHNTDPVKRQAAVLDKLLRGIPPRDIPWELPDKFHFALNLRTARALKLTIAPEVLAKADQVID